MTSLVLGFGCERGITAGAVRDGIETVIEPTDHDLDAVDLIASIDLKNDETGLLEAADELGIPLRFYDADDLNTVSPPNPNPVVRRAVGVDGVAESAALLSSPDKTLIEEKTILRPGKRGMTLALAHRETSNGKD